MTGLRHAGAIRAYEPADRAGVLALLGRALDGGPTGTRREDFFRWKHEANPFGASLALVATDAGRIVGFRAFLRWRLRAGGDLVPAVRAVDTATDPSHRGRGVFTRLTLAAVEQLGTSAQLVFNTPNRSSLPGYLKMGWRRAGTVPVAVRPARPLRFAAGLPRVRRGTPAGPPPACPLPRAADVLGEGGVAVLLAEQPGGSRLTTDRSPAYLRWRYLDPPGLDYRAIPVEGGGALTGLGICRPRRRGPLAELVLAEVLVRPGDAATARRVLRAAARAGCDYVVTHLGAGTLRRAGLAAGYATFPGVGMAFTVRPLAPLDPDPSNLGAWRLALGDLEVF